MRVDINIWWRWRSIAGQKNGQEAKDCSSYFCTKTYLEENHIVPFSDSSLSFEKKDKECCTFACYEMTLDIENF